MSEDGLHDPLDEPPMEVTVETLTGTVFDIRVFPSETILDIKNKIQRVEGIPVQHQSILFQMKEMNDYAVLADHGICNGSTLKLVLTIRGGPISTRRFTSCDHHIMWRDLKELIENSQAEGNEPGSKVSVLVYKDGEVLNVLRVVENEDGSFSPYADKHELPHERQESAVTPNDGEATEADVSQSELENTDAPELLSNDTDDGVLPETLSKVMPMSWQPYRYRRDGREDVMHKQQVEQMFQKMAEDVEMASKLQHLRRRMRQMRAVRRAKHDPVTKEVSTSMSDPIDLGAGESALKEKHRSRSNRPSAGYLHNLHVFDPLPAHSEQAEEDCHAAGHRLRMARLGLIMQEPEQDIGIEEAHQQEVAACSPAQCKVGVYQRRASLDFDGSDFGLGSVLEPGADDPDDIFYRLPTMPRYAAAATSQYQSQPPCVATRSPLYGRLSRNSNENFLTPLAQSPSPEVPERNSCNIERVPNDYIDYDDLEQDVLGYYNAEFDKYITTGIPPPASIVSGSSGLDIAANYLRGMDEELQEDEGETAGLASEIKMLTLRDFQTQTQVQDVIVPPPPIPLPLPVATPATVAPSAPSAPITPSMSSVGTSTSATGRELPPVVAKKRMRCGQCNKRLNITNIYTCRCGRIFCSQHRYSEAHDCKYDYKTEGRKLIEQQNPLVTATKLTKF